MKLAPLLALVFLSGLTTPSRCDDTDVQIEHLMMRAERQMNQALYIARATPKTINDRTIAVYDFRKWEDKEYVFRHDLDASAKDGHDLPRKQKDALARLIQFDKIVYDGMHSFIFCRPRAGHVTLHIATQILEHADLAIDGSDDSKWAPNLDAIPVGEKCP